MPQPLQQITQPTLDVLAALLDAGELHGYAASQITGRKNSTVYRILSRLARTGWVTSRREAQNPDPKRPPRLHFTLTPEAAKQTHALLVRYRAGYAEAAEQAKQPAAAAA